MSAGSVGARVWIVGDGLDPVLEAIRGAIEEPTRAFAEVHELVSAVQGAELRPECVVIHAPNPVPDAWRALTELRRGEGRRITVVLCTSLIARYRQLEPWHGLCDAVIPEAIAHETIRRHVAPVGTGEAPSGDSPRAKVVVVSGDFELRVMLADMCQRAGYAARPTATWDTARGGSLAIWDVPILDGRWQAHMRTEARTRKIVALAPFCDRGLAAGLRREGAAACLELPCHYDDLAWVLRALQRAGGASVSAHRAHRLPGPPNRGSGTPLPRKIARGRIEPGLIE